ncbi:lytic transglycosylase domain-containing protein [Streptomyces sp. ISL-36]|nr:lytic transglycosylase domain-containing protein [Streptomyces sp. ISL-36]
MATLTGSQAPGLSARAAGAQTGTEPDSETSGDTYYLTELPPLPVQNPAPSAARSVFVTDRGALPATVFAAYRRAETALATSAPGCALRWELLAAIGQVESGQARGGRVDANGTTLAPIVGPQLNGRGFALIGDSDGGAYDGDPSFDHAVGPMQFIPSTWARWGSDGNGDGRADPHNVHDAALAAGRYLCAGGRDLSRPQDLDRAILSYNRSQAYLSVVLSWYGYFRNGHRVVPDLSGTGVGTGTPFGSAPDTARTGPGGQGPGGAGASPSEPAPAPSAAPKPTPKPAPKPEPEPTTGPSPTSVPAPVPTTAPKPVPSLVTGPGTGIEPPAGGVLPDAGALPGNG